MSDSDYQIILTPELGDLLPGDILDGAVSIEGESRAFSGEVWFSDNGTPMVANLYLGGLGVDLIRVKRDIALPREGGVYWIKRNHAYTEILTTDLYRCDDEHDQWYHHGVVTTEREVRGRLQRALRVGGGLYKMEVGERVR